MNKLSTVVRWVCENPLRMVLATVSIFSVLVLFRSGTMEWTMTPTKEALSHVGPGPLTIVGVVVAGVVLFDLCLKADNRSDKPAYAAFDWRNQP